MAVNECQANYGSGKQPRSFRRLIKKSEARETAKKSETDLEKIATVSAGLHTPRMLQAVVALMDSEGAMSEQLKSALTNERDKHVQSDDDASVICKCKSWKLAINSLPMESPADTWHTPCGTLHGQTVADCEGNVWIASNLTSITFSILVLAPTYSPCHSFSLQSFSRSIRVHWCIFTHREPIKKSLMSGWPTNAWLLYPPSLKTVQKVFTTLSPMQSESIARSHDPVLLHQGRENIETW